MTEVGVTAYDVCVPSARPPALDDATGLQIAHDLLGAALGDPDLQSNVAQADVGIGGDADQRVAMV